jgi:hypothetical protein
MADHEERITRLEHRLARLIEGFTPAKDGRETWARLEDAHTRAWKQAGGTDATIPTTKIERVVTITADERADLITYLTKRGDIPFANVGGDLVITVDRGTIRVRS